MTKGNIAASMAALLTLVGGVFSVHASQSTTQKAVETGQKQQMPAAAQELDPSVVVSRYGKIVDRHPVGVGGLTAWTVEKAGRKVVLYTTSDAQAIFAGVVWDAATGRNLSDQFISGNDAITAQPMVIPPVAAEQPGVRAAAAFDGKFTGDIPESMKTVDSLAGVKEGKGGIADTLYIIIDPRCPYCRKAYNITREYVKKGYTIKWIPVVALGDPANGLPLAATILQSKDKDVVERVLGKHEQIKTQPTKETEEALRTSLAFMFAAFEKNGGQQAGVPVAFFIDHRTGKPRMMTGVSEMIVLEDIFGKL
jgi:hypothetical protein